MARTSFSTSNLTLKQLLGNGLRYIVPLFQRDYSWTKDEWEDLWQDIQATLAGGDDSAHYLGYLVLQTKDSKEFQVVDGQQRLTTLSVLALAVLKAIRDLAIKDISAPDNMRRIDTLRNTYIGYLDPVTLVSRPKLTLNRHNSAYFQNYIVPLEKLPKSRLRSDELLRKSFDFFYQKIPSEIKLDGGKLAKFLDDISDQLIFTVIIVNDELNAFTVFETLNARGVRLSPTDLLKNYLFSVVHRDAPHASEIEALDQRWEQITGRLGEESFPDFLRVHWNSRNARVRESGLYKTIRERTPDKRSAFALLRNLDDDVDTFAALTSPESDVWNPEQKRHVEVLRLFGVRQPLSLLLAARRAFSDDDFTQVLRACVIVSFRYNIIVGGATGDQETVYNSIARDVSEGRIARFVDLLRALKPVYPADREFTAAFASRSFRTYARAGKNIAMYILFHLEEARGRTFDQGSARYSLEHVLPQNPEDKWPQFSHEEASDMLHRLGNCAILETMLNRDVGNEDWEAKRAIYRRSELATTRIIAEDNAEWNAGRIASRQFQQAKAAASIWRIPQLG